ncbi:MAG TPA: hypothetical protein VK177_15430 [Flavobacteriales bacterium]|nr:hypothetical protein [Flavobacteriales bacterium]
MVKLFYSLIMMISFVCANAQNNQNAEIAELTSGNFSVYKAVGKGNDFKFELAAKPWPVDLKKEGEVYTEVTIKRAGIIEEKYQVDLPGCPAYYKSSTTDVVITVIDKKIYYYTYSIKSGSIIQYILSESKVGNYNNEKAELDDYRTKIKILQTTARTERIEENKALAEKEARENTLEGKAIKDIKVLLVNAGADIGMLSIVSIGFEVILADGTILKTKNLGGKTPYADFEVKVSGGQYSGGDLKVANDSREIPNDKIEVEAWSKFGDKKIVGKLSHPINYNSEINYQYQGASGASGRGMTVGYSENGQDGKNGRSVRINAEKLTVNGTVISHLKITDATTGQLLSEAKLNQLAKITINVSGGNGGSGCEGRSCYSGNGGSGGNAGDGGDVYLSGSAASFLQIVVMNDGGKGGKGGAAKTTNNTSGSNGSNGKKGNFYK